MKIGIEVRIDVSKIDKARLYKGAKGTYLTMTTFVDTDNPDQYDNHGFISEKQTKEESDSKTYTTILGNCKVFYKDTNGGSQHVHQQGMDHTKQAMQPPQQAPTQQQAPQQYAQAGPDVGDLDIPFANPYKGMEYLV